MTVGELVSANVVDQRVWDAYGEQGPAGVYLLGSPGTALPFVVTRAWKVGTGMVTEEIHFYGPSGRLVHRWGPAVRRMIGSMDLTVETDTISDARFDETGTYVVSFVIDDEIVGEIEVPVLVQLGSAKLPKAIEDGLKRSDVIWVGVEANGRRKLIPSWFVYRNGKIFVLSQREPGPEDQTVPGHPRRVGARRRDAAQGPRHRGGRVPRGLARAAGPRVGRRGQAPRRQAQEPRGCPERMARTLARLVRHRRAHPGPSGLGHTRFALPTRVGPSLGLRLRHDPVQGRDGDPIRLRGIEVRDERIDILGATKRVRSLVEDGEAVAAGREEVVHRHSE